MARIAFFTEKLPSLDGRSSTDAAEGAIANYSFELIRSLADQQHDVRVMSTYREGEVIPEGSTRLQIIRPFRSWSWLEIPRLIPTLLEFQPDVLHFIQPHGEALTGWTNAMTAIPSLAPLIGRPKVVLSLFDVRESELGRHRNLLLLTDSITVANRQQAEIVEKWWPENAKKKPFVTVVPLPLTSNPSTTYLSGFESEDSILPASIGLSATIRGFFGTGKTILIPGEIDEHIDLERHASTFVELLTTIPDAQIAIAGGWGRWPSLKRKKFIEAFENANAGNRVLLTGPLNEECRREAIALSHCLFSASMPAESFLLPLWIRLAIGAGIPVVLSQEQVDIDPIPWRDRENAFIVDSEGKKWGAALAEALLTDDVTRSIASRLPDFTRFEAVDRPGNVISRMYSELLAQTHRNERPS